MKPTLAFAALLLGLTACSSPDSETSWAGRTVLAPSVLAAALEHPDFVSHVKPILEAKCAMCHNKKTLPGSMNLDDRRAAFTPTKTGHLVIVPFHPEHSLLIANIRQSHQQVKAMPPVGERITKDEISVLKTWIAQGAAWPEGRDGRLKTDVK